MGLQELVPWWHESSFAVWWHKSIKKVQKDKRKGVNTVIILGAWLLWKHQNLCIF
jgi:hypothetical protein